MNKLYNLIILFAVILTACSEEPNDPNNPNDEPPEGTPTIYNVVGVWEDVEGNFISFGKDGYFCMYLGNRDNPTIQSGSYNYS